MNRPNHSWYHLRVLLVGVLIASILGSFNFRGHLVSFIDSCIVNDSGGPSKSTLQLFDETKTGEEERTEKDVDDDFEERPFFGQAEPGLVLSFPSSPYRAFRLTYPEGGKYGISSQLIYLSHHSLLI